MAKKKVGTPTLYKKEYCEQMIEYFSIEPSYEKEVVKYNKSGDPYVVTETVANDFPNFAKFATMIGVHRETLLNWSDAHPEFFDAYKKCKSLQENFITVNGMSGRINTAFGIFVAKNVLGWSDKQEIKKEVKSTLLTANVNEVELSDRIKQVQENIPVEVEYTKEEE